MRKPAPALMILCLATAGFEAALLVDPRDTLIETVAKGLGMLAMLVLALSVAVAAKKRTDAND